MSISLDQLLYGIRMVETSGRKDGYTTVNGIGATGAYQVMPENIGPWTLKAIGRAMTQAEFKASPAAQDATARYILGGYYEKYGAEGAASMWFSGQPNPNSTRSDGGNTVRQYVDKMIKFATGSNPKGSGASPVSSMPTVGHGIYTAQQAGYQADTRTNSFGAPVNPYKLPGWIASQQQASGGGGAGGTIQAADGTSVGLFGGDSVPWDGVSTVVLSTIFLLGGLGLVVVGLTHAVSP
ncbi:hypothetical protein ABZ341_41745, partial [Streptomyces sp. NPDC006173]|uniref:hypothetical protein n=1 Tax=Streptomyces sp. NPDC006173 TaxID=3155349 RepID=UPI0033F51910